MAKPKRPKPRRTSPLIFPKKLTIREIRARHRSGLSMRRAAVRNTSLFDRARRDFGGWTEAMVAAGLFPRSRLAQTRKRRRAQTGSATPVRRGPPVPLTEALLRSRLPNRTLAKVTGLHPKTIRERRQRLGIATPRSAPKTLAGSKRLLGVVPDRVIADLVGCSRSRVGALRRKLRAPAYGEEKPKAERRRRRAKRRR